MVYIEFILKTQPKTRGSYTLEINPGPGLAVCKVNILTMSYFSDDRSKCLVSAKIWRVRANLKEK